MLIRYARFSTEVPKLDLQWNALAQHGCNMVFENRASGARADRPRLSEALYPPLQILRWLCERRAAELRGDQVLTKTVLSS